MNRFAVPVLALLLPAMATAQEFRAKVRLLAFDRVGEETELRVTGAEGEALLDQPVPLPTQQLSKAVTLTRRALVFRSPADAAKVLGKVELPADEKELFLVFLPAPAGSAEAYRVHPVPMPGDKFGSGDYAFLNYSGAEVGCVIGKQRLQAPHGKAAVYQAAKDPQAGGARAIVCYAKAADGKWETVPFFSSRIIIQEGVRNLVFICRNPNSGQIDFRGVADFVE